MTLVVRTLLHCVNRGRDHGHCPAYFEPPLLTPWQNIRMHAEKVGWSFVRLLDHSPYYLDHEIDICPKCTAALDELAPDQRKAELWNMDARARAAVAKAPKASTPPPLDDSRTR
jgi:hypothetical protein